MWAIADNVFAKLMVFRYRKKDLENFLPGSQLDLNLDYIFKFLNVSTHLRQLWAVSQCFKTEIDVLTFWTIMFSACFQISTDSRISGKKKKVRFSPLKFYLSVTTKISKKSEDQNGCTTLEFYSAPHSVSKVTINAEGGSRFSTNAFLTSNYFQHRGIPEMDMILHTYWQPPASLDFSFICLSSLPLSLRKFVFYLFFITYNILWQGVSKVSYLLHEQLFCFEHDSFQLFVMPAVLLLDKPQLVFPCQSWLCSITVS